MVENLLKKFIVACEAGMKQINKSCILYPAKGGIKQFIQRDILATTFRTNKKSRRKK